eukprot:g32627.t1
MLGIYYGPPNSQQEIEERIRRQFLERCKKSRVVVVGDFNFPYIDWDTIHTRGLDVAEFVRTIQEDFLPQYVVSPTREGVILDLVLGKEPNQVSEVSEGEQFRSSDHKVLMDRNNSSPQVKVLNWRKANYNNIRQELESVDRRRLFEGVVPEDWRIANVVPLFKNGSRDNPGNYKPVSLTSVVGKLLEKIVRDKIYKHLEANRLINDKQHGFVRG